MSYVTFQSNGRGPTANVEMTAEKDLTLALLFTVEDQASGAQLVDYYIEDPDEIRLFFEEVRKMEADYKAQAGE